jgi:hypothetical protein
MMRNVFIIFVACLSMFTFAAIAQTKNTVKVEVESFARETFASVTCNQFDSQFIKTKKKVTFNDEHDLDELFSFVGKFKQIDDQEAIDVRGKITFLNHGEETTYCFDKFAVFYNDGKYFSNVPLLHFIGKKIFDDDLRYLGKLI